MHTRAATKKDIPVLSELYTQFYRYNASLQPKDCLAAKESGAYPAWILEQPLHTLFLVESENKVIGFIHLEIAETPNYPSVAAHTFGQIIDLFVLENYRRRGVGKQLIAAAKQWKVSKDLDFLELQVLGNNSQAIDFYQKMGLNVARIILRSE